MNLPAATNAPNKFLTLPNLFTFLRLCCIPLFLWMLFTRHNRAGAGFLLGVLGATDWVDGWLARRFNQVSEFGKAFDPTVDRLLFIVAISAFIIDHSAPAWFCWVVLLREVTVGGTVAVATVAFGMERFDVTWWGKTATFLLMAAFPWFMIGNSSFPAHQAFTVGAWMVGIPGLVLSWYTGIAYIPTIRAALRSGRARRG